MEADEKAIRNLVDEWLAATKAGDLEAVLKLMSDDVVFMVPGRKPFGKAAFAASSKQMQGMTFTGTSEIEEIKVFGNWAWLRNRLRIVVTPIGGQAMARSGYTLTILRKQSDGNWVITRDANLLAPETD